MRFKTFAAFVGPSLFLMFLIIAVPLGAVFWQSFHVTRSVLEQVETEVCTPGFLAPICRTELQLQSKIDESGRVVTATKFVGFQNYRNVIEPDKLWASLEARDWNALMTVEFWKALRFTLMFTLLTLPIVLITGLAIALVVNNTIKSAKGPAIFISLLPFIITPVIGALSVRWLFIGDGILTAFIEWYLERDIAMFAQAWTIELMMYLYRVWHVAPFAFVVFYAGLQMGSQDALESAITDGANRWQRLRYITIPHLKPLITFVALIHLMDAYRVFEEIIGFSSQAYVISLQYLTYDYLIPDEAFTRAIGRASASAMLTMIGIILLLVYPLRRTWLDRRRLK